MVKITAEESFLIQSHAFAKCCVKLGELEARKDPMIIKNEDQIFGQTARMASEAGISVFQGQGVLISVPYIFLVLPLEWSRKNIGEFRKLDLTDPENVARAVVEVKIDTYGGGDKEQALKHLKHFRNALAHGRIGWNDGNLVVKDEKGESCKYEAEYSTENLGNLAQSLNLSITNYIGSVIKGREQIG